MLINWKQLSIVINKCRLSSRSVDCYQLLRIFLTGGGVRTNFPHFLNFFIFSCPNSCKSAEKNFSKGGGVTPSADHQNLKRIHNIDQIYGILQVFQVNFFFFCRKCLLGHLRKIAVPLLFSSSFQNTALLNMLF